LSEKTARSPPLKLRLPSKPPASYACDFMIIYMYYSSIVCIFFQGILLGQAVRVSGAPHLKSRLENNVLILVVQ